VKEMMESDLRSCLLLGEDYVSATLEMV
jgi:hypothetical protein